MTIDVADGAAEFARTRLEPLRRFAYVICGSVAEADDLAQIAIIEVWRRWRTASANPEAYARRVIVTRNVSRWRRRQREVPLVAAEGGADDPAADFVDNVAVWQALRRLGRAERIVVVLHVLYEYTFGEIAAITGEPQGTVSSRYSRARRTLREGMGNASTSDRAVAPLWEWVS
jgi:RNA polymerase sigma factor (sigma-70 family)